MRTISDRLQAAIDQQQAEVDRLTAIAKQELPIAQQKLARLQQLRKAITPDVEAGYATLRAAGISLDSE